MGQIVRGILYGCPAPEGLRFYDDDDGLGPGLSDLWDALPKKKRSGFTISLDCEGDTPMVGLWVAIECGGRDRGARDLGDKCIDLAAVSKMPAAARALAAWPALAALAAEQGYPLPKPSFWLVPTEVA